jgi:sulfur-carrier protein
MHVRIPSPLRSYTDQQANVTAVGGTINDVLHDLDRQFPGLRFRVVDEQGNLRKHMRVFVNEDIVRDLTTSLNESDLLTLMQGLSGGA